MYVLRDRAHARAGGVVQDPLDHVRRDAQPGHVAGAPSGAGHASATPDVPLSRCARRSAVEKPPIGFAAADPARREHERAVADAREVPQDRDRGAAERQHVLDAGLGRGPGQVQTPGVEVERPTQRRPAISPRRWPVSSSSWPSTPKG